MGPAEVLRLSQDPVPRPVRQCGALCSGEEIEPRPDAGRRRAAPAEHGPWASAGDRLRVPGAVLPAAPRPPLHPPLRSEGPACVRSSPGLSTQKSHSCERAHRGSLGTGRPPAPVRTARSRPCPRAAGGGPSPRWPPLPGGPCTQVGRGVSTQVRRGERGPSVEALRAAPALPPHPTPRSATPTPQGIGAPPRRPGGRKPITRRHPNLALRGERTLPSRKLLPEATTPLTSVQTPQWRGGRVRTGDAAPSLTAGGAPPRTGVP